MDNKTCLNFDVLDSGGTLTFDFSKDYRPRSMEMGFDHKASTMLCNLVLLLSVCSVCVCIYCIYVSLCALLRTLLQEYVRICGEMSRLMEVCAPSNFLVQRVLEMLC